MAVEDFKAKDALGTTPDNRASWMEAFHDFKRSGAPEMMWNEITEPKQVRSFTHAAGIAAFARSGGDDY